MNIENLGRDLESMFDAGSSVLTLEEIQEQVIGTSSRRVAKQRPWGIAAAIFLIVVAGGVFIGLLSRPIANAPSTTEPAAALGGPILAPVQLGMDYLWPSTPKSLPEVDLAEQFASEVLDWDSAAITAFEPSQGEPPRVHIHQPGVDELVDALFSTTGSGTVITDVGPPWFTGLQISPLAPDGMRIHLLGIGDDVTGEVTVLLWDDTYIVVSKTIHVGVVDSTFVDLPDVRPEDIRSVLIRYVDTDGNVIAANGQGALSVSSLD